MSLAADWFRREFLQAEHAAENVIHTAEKELTMIPQAFADALARIKAALASHTDQSAADAKTISDLKDANASLQGQVTDLTGKLSDATSQIADMEQAAIDAAPAA